MIPFDATRYMLLSRKELIDTNLPKNTFYIPIVWLLNWTQTCKLFIYLRCRVKYLLIFSATNWRLSRSCGGLATEREWKLGRKMSRLETRVSKLGFLIYSFKKCTSLLLFQRLEGQKSVSSTFIVCKIISQPRNFVINFLS